VGDLVTAWLTIVAALLTARIARAGVTRWRYNRAARRADAARWTAVDGPWRVWLAEVRVRRLHAQREALIQQRQAVAR
jgi:hypothetical protein